jgi:hypothetical protein
LLFVLGLAIGVGTAIGALFLLAACALYNGLVGGRGSPESVPELLPGKAMGIILGTSLVHAAAIFVIGRPAGIGRLLSLPVSLLVMAGLNSALLPTTFARGLLVALCYLLLALAVVLVLTIPFGGLSLVDSLLR